MNISNRRIFLFWIQLKESDDKKLTEEFQDASSQVQAIEGLNVEREEVYFKSIADKPSLYSPLNYDDVWPDLIQIKEEKTDSDDIAAFFTPYPLRGNLFSIILPKYRLGIFTTYDWDEYYSPPSLRVYIVHCLLRLIGFIFFDLKNHMDTRGCPMDYCGYKLDIKVAMREGRFCEECQDIIKKLAKLNENKDAQSWIDVFFKKIKQWYEKELKL